MNSNTVNLFLHAQPVFCPLRAKRFSRRAKLAGAFGLCRPVCWPQATLDRPLRLIIIKEAGYRLCKGSALLYREPAYLIATSFDFAPSILIEAYLGRWEIEVNFREEKNVSRPV